MDFILGYEIKLSHSHPCHDICEDLKGKYPKDFKWTRWHPNDLCYVITISKKGIKEWLNQPHKHYESKNELLLKIDEVLSTSIYKGVLPDINNDSISAHLFETTINGDLSWIIVRLTPEDIARLYSITDSDKMIGLIKNNPQNGSTSRNCNPCNTP